MDRHSFTHRFRMPWEPIKLLPTTDSSSKSTASRRLRFLNWMPLSIKNHFVAMASEFVGTFMFLFMAFGGTNAVNSSPPGGEQQQTTTAPNDAAKLMYISLSFGMSLVVNAWVFFRISGGLFNPAVTLGMMLIGAVGYLRGVLVIISQIIGGIAAAGVLRGLLPGTLNIQTLLAGGTSVVQGLFIEMFLTAQLVFTIFMLAAEKHRATFIAPIGIGLSLFIAELLGAYYTGGAVNPARAFAPSAVLGTFYGYHWIYWLGPVLGSLLASGFYIFIKALEYETVNPGQDAITDEEDKGTAFDPVTGDEVEVRNGAQQQQQPSAAGAGPGSGRYQRSPELEAGSRGAH